MSRMAFFSASNGLQIRNLIRTVTFTDLKSKQFVKRHRVHDAFTLTIDHTPCVTQIIVYWGAYHILDLAFGQIFVCLLKRVFRLNSSCTLFFNASLISTSYGCEEIEFLWSSRLYTKLGRQTFAILRCPKESAKHLA